MNHRPRRSALLGLAALAAYVLACSPAFSPDGRRILVTSTADGGTRLLLFDRRRAEWSTLLQLGPTATDDGHATAAWSADGREAIALWASQDDALSVCAIPIEGRRPARIHRLSIGDDAATALILPPAMARNRLLLGGKAIHALDLATGEVTSRPVPRPTGETNDVEVLVSAQPDGPYCWYGKDRDITLGRVDPESLSVTPVLRIEDADEGGFFFAVSPTGDRTAVSLEADHRSVLRLYRSGKVEREIRLGSPDRPVQFGGLVWSPNGATLYAANFEKAHTNSNESAFSVQEIKAEGGDPRRIPLFRVMGEDDTAPLVYQLALSPDGKTLAAFGGISAKETSVAPDDWALFLIDLTRSDRRVKKYRMPL